MARTSRFVFRLLLAATVGGGAYLAWLSSFGSPSPIDLLPPGAFGVVETRDVEKLARRVSNTRFGAAFAHSATREWLEHTEAVRAFDAVLDEIRRVSGVSPGRSSAFDLIGEEAAVAWYPPDGSGTAAAPWVAGGRLSLRAWAAATAMRVGMHLGTRFGFGARGVTREESSGRVVYSFPGSDGQALHVFLAGRVLVGSSDRSLALKAALAAGDAHAALSSEPAWLSIRRAVPEHGELFLWARDGSTLPGAAAAGRSARGSVGVLVHAGETIEIDVAALPASPPPAPGGAAATPEPLPALSLLGQAPLFLYSSSAPPPSAVVDQLLTRQSAVARRSGVAPPTGPLLTGNGFALVVTAGDGGNGLFPTPRGLVTIGMGSPSEAARLLALLFPPGARTGSGGGARALATRESFPLAGEFELWGAAVGSQLVFATDTALIDTAATVVGGDFVERPKDTAWPVETLSVVSMEKLLPLLRRWRAPLSGLVATSWPDVPDVTRDLDLLAAVGTLRVAAGSDERFDRAVITFDVHDLR